MRSLFVALVILGSLTAGCGSGGGGSTGGAGGGGAPGTRDDCTAAGYPAHPY
jgi:hypothetical protein